MACSFSSLTRSAAQDKPAEEQAARFRDRGEFVEDTQTGLLWQKDGEASGKKNFYDAAEYAKKLKLGGLTGWRVPTAAELETIFPAKEAPFTNSGYNPDKCCGGGKEFRGYWTSELDPRVEDYAFLFQWYAGGGKNNCFASKNFVFVRCVRGTLAAGETPVASTTEPAPKLDEKTIARAKALIAQLGAEQFADREKAAEELKSLGSQIAPLLREALEKATDAEVRFRLKGLLNRAE
ncbi:MAG TPA: DUF1566 domain-containing protein [Pirellulaceae bacterium]|nr:DUF1566 domain-containing protein [Pirellulaceae bacterium]